MPTRKLHWSFAYILQALVASYGVTLCIFVVGLLLPNRAALDPLTGPYFWGAIVFGVVGGIFLGRRERPSILLLLWVLPCLLLLNELYVAWKYQYAGENLRQSIYDNFLGRDCGGSECLIEGIITTPLICAITYGIAALVAKPFFPDANTSKLHTS